MAKASDLNHCLAALERRHPRRVWLDGLFPQQVTFLKDPAKRKAALCGRRAGKTWVAAVGLYDAAVSTARCLCAYVALSAVQARRIFWPVLVAINDRYQLGMKMRENELIAELPNGSKIFCVGGDDARKVEALRGAPYKRVVIDEPGSFPRRLLQYLIDDVLDAAFVDLDGDLWLIGTPNAACAGFFYDVTTGANPDVARVPTHHWTMLDNPNVSEAREKLERKISEHRWTWEHPTVQREWLGHWVRDTSALVFRFDRARHMVAEAPALSASVVGVDLGASRQVATTAFVVVGWTPHDRTTYTVHAERTAGLTPTTAGERAAALQRDHHARYVVVDEGALGAGYAEEWRVRAGLAVQAAQKRDKYAFVEFLNGELDAGRVKLVDGAATRPLVDELELLQWNEDRDGYDERFSDHCADAWLYAWRECYAWREPPAKAPLPPAGSAEAIEAEEERYRRERFKQAQKNARRAGQQLLNRYR